MTSNLDFLALSETWLSTSTPTCMIDVPGYSCYRKDRPSRGGGGWGMGGGVMLYIKETLKCAEVKLDIAGLECLTLNVIMSPKNNFNVVTV